MELQDEMQIRIVRILEIIERMNKAIAFHKSFEAPDDLAIEQYQEIKNQVTQELFELLAEMEVYPPVQAAA